MNVSFRLKKWRNLTRRSSGTMPPASIGSNGRRMVTANEFSAPAPWTPAVMMPGPPPVMTIQSFAANAAPSSCAARYATLPSGVRADPKIEHLRRSR